jgi:hypothetical protein
MTAEVIGPHETYQFKGDYLDSRPANESDRPVWRACRERFAETVGSKFPGRWTEEILRRSSAEPALAVRFRVREIFVQTPGPAAGRRLFPGEP